MGDWERGHEALLAEVRALRARCADLERLGGPEGGQYRHGLPSILDQTREAVVLVDRQLKVTYTNAAAQGVLGRSGDEMSGRAFTQLCSEVRGTRCEAELEAALVDGEMRSFEVEWPLPLRRDWLEVRVIPQTGGLALLCQVISRRKQTERDLAELEQLFAVSLDLLGIADTKGVLHRANPAWERTLGYSAAELVGQPLCALVHPADQAALWAALDRLRQQELVPAVVVRLRSRDGGYRSMECGASLAGETLFLAARDVTERVVHGDQRAQLERQMQHAQKLDSLGVLAGGIAHDFNNLLTAILGNADLALSDMSAVAPGRECLLEITRVARRAAELCRQMLAYSGRGKFVVEPVDLSQMIEEMLHIIEVSISRKAVLRLDLAPSLPPVEADVSQLRQALLSLVLNGSEAIGERSGVLGITTGHLDCDKAYLAETWLDEDLPAGQYVYLEVADTGCGMDEETRARIFDPFFSTKFAGRGLGLAAVLGIVRGHHGAIKVYTEVGRGTTVKMLLPVSAQRCQPVAEAGNEAEWRGHGAVLLVDDEETIRLLGQRILERCGFQPLLAEDGRAALECFRQHRDRIVCVVLDLTMPHMNGDEAFRELRRIDPGVRVILSSGYHESDVTQRFAGKGLAGFIQKPYQSSGLIRILRQVLGADAPS